MSEVNKKIKDVTQELDFLNGEAGKKRDLLLSLDRDIAALELEKKKQHEQFLADSETAQLQRNRIENELTTKSQELDSARIALQNANDALENANDELVTVTQKFAFERERTGQEILILKDKQKELTILGEVINQRIQSADAREKDITEREISVSLRETSLVTSLQLLEDERQTTVSQNNLLIEKSTALDEELRTVEAIKHNIQNTEQMLANQSGVEKEKSEQLNHDIAKIAAQTAALSVRETDLHEKEKENEQMKETLWYRERDVSLRERECKVREKMLAVREKEEQLQ